MTEWLRRKRVGYSIAAFYKTLPHTLIISTSEQSGYVVRVKKMAFFVDTLIFLDLVAFKRHEYDENAGPKVRLLNVICLICPTKKKDLVLSDMNVYHIHCLLKLDILSYICTIHISTRGL